VPQSAANLREGREAGTSFRVFAEGREREIVAIVRRSGSGKSTLLHLLGA